MMWNFTKILIAAVVLAVVTEVSRRNPRLGALVLSLPIVSILAFLLSWQQSHDLQAISKLAKETLILVPLGLPTFIPLAFSAWLGIGFWMALSIGIVLSTISIGLWYNFGPEL